MLKMTGNVGVRLFTQNLFVCAGQNYLRSFNNWVKIGFILSLSENKIIPFINIIPNSRSRN